MTASAHTRRRARLSHIMARIPGAGLAARGHAALLRLSRGRVGRRYSGLPVLVLETQGRRSGQLRSVPLVFIEDCERIVVLPAAGGSDRTPRWWLNLQADPHAVVYLGGDRRAVTAREATGGERDRLWHRFAEVYPDIDAFSGFTSRQIPVVVLEPDPDRPIGGARNDDLGERRTVQLTQGRIQFHERGDGPPLLFVHGLWVNGDVWRKVVPALAQHYRCIVPDWPFGAHAYPMAADADLSPTGVADVIADFVTALDLDDLAVIASDTGLAFTQVFVTRHPDKLDRLVAMPGDVLWNFLPLGIKWMRPISQIPGAMRLVAQFWNSRPGRTLIMPPLTRTSPPAEVLDSWFGPATRSRELRRDIVKLLRDARPRATITAASELHRFRKPALVVWSATRNVTFPLRHARFLQTRLSNARLELIPDTGAFISEDQPLRLTDAIMRFAASDAHPRPARAEAS